MKNRILGIDEPVEPVSSIATHCLSFIGGLALATIVALGIPGTGNRLDDCRAAAVERLNEPLGDELAVDRNLEASRECREYNRGALDMLEGLILPIDVD